MEEKEEEKDMALLFSEYQMKDVRLRNRIVMSPMCQYTAAENGEVNDWHIMHYGARAAGGVGLIIVEATAVEARGRLSNHDLGLWCDEQIAGMRRLVDFCHRQGAAIAVQLAHAGRKSWGHELIAPLPLRFSDEFPVPREMSKSDIETVIESFAAGARRAREAGFDAIELHGAHGYLINQFLSPLTNQREDEYGGSVENRMRFLLEVLGAVKEEWPAEKPILVRLSAVDYYEGGVTLNDTVQLAKELRKAGVDVIDVSSGGIMPVAPKSGPGYQVPMAEAVKEGAEIPTIAVGLITEPEHAEEILFNERADLVALGRELLRNPHWPLYAAERLGVEVDWPKQYIRAKRR